VQGVASGPFATKWLQLSLLIATAELAGEDVMGRSARVVLAAVLAAATLGPAAKAQFGPPQGAQVLGELVVRGPGGPPWWQVSSEASTVYILAEPGLMPKEFQFDRRLLERRLTGADALIIGPKVKLGADALFMLPKLLALQKQIGRNKGLELEPSLPPELRRRFVAARERIGQPPERYGGLPSGLAGMALAGDTYATWERQTKNADPPQALEALVIPAAKGRTSLRSAGALGAKDFRQFFDEVRRPDQACLASILDQLDKGPSARLGTPPRPEALRAWADGDVRPVLEAAKAQRSGIMMVFGTKPDAPRLALDTRTCQDQMPFFAQAGAKWLDLQTEAIVKALKRKGHSVAIVGAVPLLVQDGVLDRLRRQGYTVRLPNAPG
jgi:hypothetical protein